MGVREQFDKIICDEIPEILEVIGVEEENRAAVAIQVRDKLNEAKVVERLMNVAQVHYETPPNIVEIRAHLDKYTIQDKKSLTIQVLAMNDLQNKLKMAMLGNSAITIRGLQSDIEAGSIPGTSSRSEDTTEIDPDQLTFDDAPDGDDTANIDLSNKPTIEVTQYVLPDEEITVEPYGNGFLAHGPGFTNPHDRITGIGDTQEEAIEAFRTVWANFAAGVSVTRAESGEYEAESCQMFGHVLPMGFGPCAEDAIWECKQQIEEEVSAEALVAAEDAEAAGITVNLDQEAEPDRRYMACGADFVNETESPCGYGPTREAAIADYTEDVRLREIATQGTGKKRRKKKEDAEANAAA